MAVSTPLSLLIICCICWTPSEDGLGELYTYLPQTERNTERLLLVPPKSIQHADYGFSVGRGAFSFNPGRWTRVTQRVKMNGLRNEDGTLGLLSLLYLVAHDAFHQERLRSTSMDSRSCMLPGSYCAPMKVRMDVCKDSTCRHSLAVCLLHICSRATFELRWTMDRSYTRLGIAERPASLVCKYLWGDPKADARPR